MRIFHWELVKKKRKDLKLIASELGRPMKMNSISFAPSGKLRKKIIFKEISNFVSSFKLAHGKKIQTYSGTVINWKEFPFCLHSDKADQRFFRILQIKVQSSSFISYPDNSKFRSFRVKFLLKQYKPILHFAFLLDHTPNETIPI